MRLSGPTCEGSRRLDIIHMKRQGMLQPDRRSALSWSLHGVRTAAVSIQATSDGVRLTSKTAAGTEAVSEFVPYSQSRTNFGGVRLWLTCLGCSRRVRVLFGGQRFRCRKCHGLHYASQYEPDHERALDQADRLQRRLGGEAGDDDLPDKPKWMRWATYERLQRQHDDLKARWIVGLLSSLRL